MKSMELNKRLREMVHSVFYPKIPLLTSSTCACVVCALVDSLLEKNNSAGKRKKKQFKK